MNIIYLGTPDFAIYPLQKIMENGHNILAVVTQTDKPKGRKGEISFPPLKDYALKCGLKVLQFEKIKEHSEQLKKLNADIMITCAYGQILTQEIIDICPYGIINIHASLLPKYRGAAPIQWAIINGETETGVTVMQTDAGLDTGDIIYTLKTDLKPNETAGELFEKLSVIGGEAIVQALNLIENGKADLKKQVECEATKVKTIKKENAIINFNNSAQDIKNLIRGLNPAPIAFTYFKGQILKIYKAIISDISFNNVEAGKIMLADSKKGLYIGTKNGVLKIEELQIAGGKRMAATDFLRGNKLTEGDFLGRINE
jgi:methionyl-tRNA formyltransferase